MFNDVLLSMWFGLRRVLARRRVPLRGWFDSGRYLHRPAQETAATKKAPSMPVERKGKTESAEKEKKLLLLKWEEQLIEFRSSSKESTVRFSHSFVELTLLR